MTIAPPKRYFLVILLAVCMTMTGSLPLSAQNQRTAPIDSALLVYYNACRRHVTEPIVLRMTDTLYNMAGELGDTRMQAVAATTKLDYYYYLPDVPIDTLIYWTNYVKRVARQLHQPRYYFFAWGSRLIIHYLTRRQYQIALKETEEMLKEAQRENFLDGIADAHKVMANIYGTLGLTDRQLEYTLLEIDLFQQNPNLQRYNIAQSYSIAAKIYTDRGEYDTALSFLEKGKQCIPNTDTGLLYIQVMDGYADLYCHIGDAEAVKKILDDSRELVGKQSSPLLKTSFYQREVNYYELIGDNDAAIRSNEMCISIARSANNRNSLLIGYHRGALLYDNKGDKVKSAEYYRKYIELTQEEAQEDAVANISEINTVLEKERMDRENVNLRIEYLRQQTQYIVTAAICLSIGILILSFLGVKLVRLNRQIRISRNTLKAKNKEIENSNRQLEEARMRADASVAQKNYFIKLISHELRTPLNAIVGFASILRTMGLDEKVQKATHLIDENTQKLLSMTDVLLEKEIDEET